MVGLITKISSDSNNDDKSPPINGDKNSVMGGEPTTPTISSSHPEGGGGGGENASVDGSTMGEWDVLDRIDDDMEQWGNAEQYRKEDRLFGSLQGKIYHRGGREFTAASTGSHGIYPTPNTNPNNP